MNCAAPASRTIEQIRLPLELRKRGNAPAARFLVLATVDAVSLLVGGVAAYLAWALPVHGQSAATYLPAAAFAPLIVLGYAQGRLYPGFGLGPVEMLRRYSLITMAAFAVLAGLVLLLKLENVYSRVTLVLALAISLVLVPTARWIALRGLRRFSWWPEPVLLVLDASRREHAGQLLAGWPSADMVPVGSVEITDGWSQDSMGVEGVEQAEAYARAGVRVAFLDLDAGHGGAPVDRLRLLFPRVILLRQVQDLPVEGVQVQNLGGLLGLEYGNNLLRRQSRWVKRAMDLSLGSIALVLSLPVLAVAIVAVKLASRGPGLFVQGREGRAGRTIRVPKIRTMRVGAEEEIERHVRSEPGLREEWTNGFKLRHDPRIIPGVGTILRRFSIDELPQLLSVVRGDMSLVGPRPFPRYHLDALSEESRHLRRQVRPGLTGLWQVTARGLADVGAQEAYDIYYIRNWSLWLDVYILAKTIVPVLTGRGAN